ncbi:MAG TPA: low specificity L-threonine aldolase [Opitutus sp.]|nr:low specificity L-threonine aldolase [Opitutus sp.]
MNYAFASDNTAAICPEAFAAFAEANAGCAPSYGDDPWTARARALLREIFATDCAVFFVFNGTAANALALAALCQRHHGILCHALSHVDTDECGAPEFFTGGAKVIPLDAPAAKLRVGDLAPVLHRGHGVHYPKLRALSLTQSTELGTVYTVDELRELADFAHAHGWSVHVDGARFANALAAQNISAADATWRAGVDVLCLGGTKNGLSTTEAVVFFNRELAREFEYRVKQSGQLASKMRFAAAQWVGALRDGAWLRHAAHANACARRLADGLRPLAALRLLFEPAVNGVFVEMPPAVFDALTARGWHFYKFIGEHGYRLMTSWATTEAEVDAFIADARAATKKSGGSSTRPTQLPASLAPFTSRWPALGPVPPPERPRPA